MPAVIHRVSPFRGEFDVATIIQSFECWNKNTITCVQVVCRQSGSGSTLKCGEAWLEVPIGKWDDSSKVAPEDFLRLPILIGVLEGL